MYDVLTPPTVSPNSTALAADPPCSNPGRATPPVGAKFYIVDWSSLGGDAASGEALLERCQRIPGNGADRLLVVAHRAPERTKIRIARLLADAGFRLTNLVVDDGGCTVLEARRTHRN